MDYSSKGYLSVYTYTAEQAIPIPNLNVRISGGEESNRGMDISLMTLEVAIDVGVDEQYSSLIGNFLVVKSGFASLDKIGDVVAAGQSSGHGRSGVGGVFCEAVSIDFQFLRYGSLSHTRLICSMFP